MKNLEYISSDQLALKLIKSLFNRVKELERKKISEITKEEFKEWKRLKDIQRNFNSN